MMPKKKEPAPLPTADPHDPNRAETRRLRRAHCAATDILDEFSRASVEGCLITRAVKGRPYHLRQDNAGHVFEMFGIRTPACTSITAAIVCWARLAQEPVTEGPGL